MISKAIPAGIFTHFQEGAAARAQQRNVIRFCTVRQHHAPTEESCRLFQVRLLLDHENRSILPQEAAVRFSLPQWAIAGILGPQAATVATVWFLSSSQKQEPGEAKPTYCAAQTHGIELQQKLGLQEGALLVTASASSTQRR